MAYTRTYVYTNSDNYYHTEAQDYAFGSFAVFGGDTEHAITKIISIEATTAGYVGTSQSAARLGWTATLITATGSFSASTQNDAKTNPGKWGSLYVAWDVSQITADDFNSLLVFRSDADGGSGTRVKDRPIYLTVTYESGEYFPKIDRFSVERCDVNGDSNPEGTHAKYAFALSVAKTDSAAAAGAAYSLVLTDDIGHTIIGANTLSAVAPYISVAGVTTTDVTQNEYDGGVETLFTLTVVYHDEPVASARVLFPASVDGISIGYHGVGIGVYAEGTQGDELFKTPWRTEFKGLSLFEFGEVPCGAVKKSNGDRVKTYRYVAASDSVSGNGAVIGTLPADAFDVIKLYGTILPFDNMWRAMPTVDPVNTATWSAQFYIDGRDIKIQCGSGIGTGIQRCIAVVEYTKGW